MEIAIGDLVLRRFRLDDAAALREAADNPRVAANLRDRFPSPYSLADARAFIADAEGRDPILQFAIARAAPADRVIGVISLRPLTDEQRHCAELGFFLAEPEWGRGIATHAVRAMTDYGFGTLGLLRIHAHVFDWNPASRRVLSKAGFTHEGILRRAVMKADRIMDMHCYAKLAEGT